MHVIHEKSLFTEQGTGNRIIQKSMPKSHLKAQRKEKVLTERNVVELLHL